MRERQSDRALWHVMSLSLIVYLAFIFYAPQFLKLSCMDSIMHSSVIVQMKIYLMKGATTIYGIHYYKTSEFARHKKDYLYKDYFHND